MLPTTAVVVAVAELELAIGALYSEEAVGMDNDGTPSMRALVVASARAAASRARTDADVAADGGGRGGAA